MPPGALDLPNVFEAAMKLVPTSLGTPGKASAQQPLSSASNRNTLPPDDYFAGHDEGLPRKEPASAPGSPSRKSNKENTPPGSRQDKQPDYLPSPAAVSRHELYPAREQPDPTGRRNQISQRGLTPDELEKLQKPSVKRLANVTQLCKFPVAVCTGHSLTTV